MVYPGGNARLTLQKGRKMNAGELKPSALTPQMPSFARSSGQANDAVRGTDRYEPPTARPSNFLRRAAVGWDAYITETAKHRPGLGEYCMLSMGTVCAVIGGTAAFVGGVVVGALELKPDHQPIHIPNDRGAEVALGTVLIVASFLHLTTAVGLTAGGLVGAYTGAAIGYPIQAIIACSRLGRAQPQLDAALPASMV